MAIFVGRQNPIPPDQDHHRRLRASSCLPRGPSIHAAITPHPIARMMFYEAVCLDAGAELHEACPEE